jgi:hypothetical protein
MICKFCGEYIEPEETSRGCMENNGGAHEKRGRGRPRKIVRTMSWNEVLPKTIVRVAGERGDFSFFRLADEGKSATVWSPNTGMRTFSIERVTVK